MALLINDISQDTIVQIVSIFVATLTFIIAQRYEKSRDRQTANREIYQNLEFASMELFRFEAENIDMIRPVWEKGATMPEKNTAEFMVTMNYICQMLNLFEIAIKFRKDKTMPPDIFGTWVAWFYTLAMSPGPGFDMVWKDIRKDYLPDLRQIMDEGQKLKTANEPENEKERRFYLFISNLFECDIIRDWTGEQEKSPWDNTGTTTETPAPGHQEMNPKQELNSDFHLTWLRDKNRAGEIAQLFVNHVHPNYISHGEIQEGRALDEIRWSPDLFHIILDEIKEATANDIFHKANVAIAEHQGQLIGYALVEFISSGREKYAVLSDIMVHSDWRRNKVGETLVQWIFNQLQATDLTSMFAESNARNTVAHDFLEKQGFTMLSNVFLKKLGISPTSDIQK